MRNFPRCSSPAIWVVKTFSSQLKFSPGKKWIIFIQCGTMSHAFLEQVNNCLNKFYLEWKKWNEFWMSVLNKYGSVCVFVFPKLKIIVYLLKVINIIFMYILSNLYLTYANARFTCCIIWSSTYYSYSQYLH